MERQKITVKAVSSKTNAVLVVNPEGIETWFKVTDVVKPFLDRVKPGQAEMDVTTEVDEEGIPFIRFIRNVGQVSASRSSGTGFSAGYRAGGDQYKPAWKKNDSSTSQLTSYAKDIFVEAYKLKGPDFDPQKVAQTCAEVVAGMYNLIKSKTE